MRTLLLASAAALSLASGAAFAQTTTLPGQTSTITVPIGGGVGPEQVASGGFAGPRGTADAPGVPGQGVIPGTRLPMDEMDTVEDRGEAGGTGTDR